MKNIVDIIAEAFSERDLSNDTEYNQLYDEMLKAEEPIIEKVNDISQINNLEIAVDCLNGYRIECAIKFTLDFIRQFFIPKTDE